jgi:protein TonB
MDSPLPSSHLRARSSERPPPPVGLVVPTRDPLSRVMDLGKKTPTFIAVGVLLALLVHGTAAARVAFIAVDLLHWERGLRMQISERLASTYEIDVAKPKEPEPPPPEEVKKDEPKEEPKAPPPPAPKENAPPPPPPAAAQAGAVLTKEPDPNEPVDFTNTFVSGSGATFAGGVTQAGGTSTQAVYNRNATAQGVPGGTGTAPAPPAPPAPDRSRPLRVSGSKDWSCSDLFPAEADSEDEMLVETEVTVGPDGRVKDVRVLRDPGNGFGRAAIQCARRQSPDAFEVALDRDGNPILGKKNVRIRFTR